MTLEERVRELVVEQLGVDPEVVGASASFTDDLGADSLDIVELVMALEEKFGIDIVDEDAEKMVTFQDVCSYVETKLAQN